MIKKLVQGESPESDRELWCLIGAWAVSEAVHEAVGLAITGRPGDIWHIDIRKGQPTGFAQTRILKHRKAHLRYAYSEKQSIQEGLTIAVLKMAQEMGLPTVFTNDRELAPVPKKLGFTICHARKGGGFCRWEKELTT